jgi:short-subunit dehydrogenase
MAKERTTLIGRVGAITGGARGIGKATADALVRKGGRIAIGDLDVKVAEEAAASLGGNAIALPLDVTDRESFEWFLEETERQLGPVDIVVNNAGIMPVTPFVEESEESMRRQVDINLHGVLIGTQLAMRRMEPRGSGHIVNVASSAGRVGVPGIATYSGTKHAVVGLSEAIRHELRGTGVEVSVVMPVLVNTALTEGLSEKRGVREVEPEDVAAAIVEALEVNRFDVYVPRSLQATISLGALLPRRAREAIARFMGVHEVMDVKDPGVRRAYEERAARSKRDAAAAEAEGEADSDAAPGAAKRDAA